jgi:hypothetical protein
MMVCSKRSLQRLFNFFIVVVFDLALVGFIEFTHSLSEIAGSFDFGLYLAYIGEEMVSGCF